MKLSSIQSITPFKGIAPPYVNRYGFKVIPIAQNPNQNDINSAIQITQKETPHEGCNGRAYFWGEDLIVKEYKTPDKAINYDPQREIKALDRLYEAGIRGNSSIQEGEYAFKTPDGRYFLVSTRIKGKSANNQNKFNKENLESLLDTLSILDTPKCNKSKREILEREGICDIAHNILMHYDLAMGNINITEQSAGVFDFEYLGTENIEKLERAKRHSELGTNPNMSDVSPYPSNLRGFEYRCLYKYLNKIDPKEAKELFCNYLKLKGKYYKKVARETISTTKLSQTDATHDISDKYSFLGCFLEHFYYDPAIIKAEAMKIQIAHFIFEQSPAQMIPSQKVNPEQIKQYISDAKDYFKKMKNEATIGKNPWLAQDYERYFSMCLELMDTWQQLGDWMDWQAQEPDSKYFAKILNSITDEKNRNFIKEDYERQVSNHKIYLSKLSDDYITTLDEIVCD